MRKAILRRTDNYAKLAYLGLWSKTERIKHSHDKKPLLLLTVSTPTHKIFSVESDGEGPRSKFKQEDGQTESEKMARVGVCIVSGATSQSCKVTTRVIQNVQD